jgi:uncharacterized protein (TIGR00299 family) protein
MLLRTLYLECFSGISGDMTVAALLDLGIDKNIVFDGLNSLGLDGYEIKIGKTCKCGIVATDFDVILHNLQHENDIQKHHDDQHTHTHEHRSLSSIEELIDNSGLNEKVKALAIKIFRILGESEAEVHGIDLEEVHFHEVGAIDSIVDIVAASICIDALKIDRIICSPLYDGIGFQKCIHGLVPVPVPAVLNIAKTANIPMKSIAVNGEMVTPTGAAIVAAIADEFAEMPQMTISQIGYGAGKKDFSHANLLRAIVGETNNSDMNDQVVVLETNIDDSTPEALGFCMERLTLLGVNDVYFTPIYMKKNRPAYLLTVLCRENLEKDVIRAMFLHTSSIGLRRRVSNRIIMSRTEDMISTEFGDIAIKRCKFEDIEKNYVEFESAKNAAIRNDVSLDVVYGAVWKWV